MVGNYFSGENHISLDPVVHIPVPTIHTIHMISAITYLLFKTTTSMNLITETPSYTGAGQGLELIWGMINGESLIKLNGTLFQAVIEGHNNLLLDREDLEHTRKDKKRKFMFPKS
jgi:hypothetical protein